MNINRAFPLVLLLLISLSIPSFATYYWGYHSCSWSQQSPTHNGGCSNFQGILHRDTNQMEVTVWITGSCGDISCLPVTAGANTVYLTWAGVANGTYYYGQNAYSSFLLKTTPFTINCVGVYNYNCTGTGYLSGANSYYPNGPVNTSLNLLTCGTTTSDTTLKWSNYGTSQNANYETFWGDGNYMGVGGIVVLYKNSDNSYITTGSIALRHDDIPVDTGYVFYNRDSSECITCSNGVVTCASNVTKESQICINNANVPHLSCLAGGWETCGLSNYTECPSVTPPAYQFNVTSCFSDANCSSNQFCSCNANEIYNNTDASPHNASCASILGPTPDPGLWGLYTCVNKPYEDCNNDADCSLKLCLDKGSSGVGHCANACTSNLSCSSGSVCKDIYNNPNYQNGPVTRGDYNLKEYTNKLNYCVAKLGVFCENKDSCYSESCQDQCDNSNIKRCTIPGFNCWCYSSADCTSGSCIQQPYSGPLLYYLGAQVCVVGKSNGDTCTSDSECVSNNCNNNRCCASGYYCCASDSQCSSGSVCLTSSAWSLYPQYYSCSEKVPGQGMCGDDKECVTPPCNGGYCSGSGIKTSYNYIWNPSSYNYLPLYSTLLVKMNYTYLNGSPISEPTYCDLFDSRFVNRISTGSCNAFFSLPLGIEPSYTFHITAWKSGYDTQIGSTFIVNTYDNRSSNGNSCTNSSQCLSSFCGPSQANPSGQSYCCNSPSPTDTGFCCKTTADCALNSTYCDISSAKCVPFIYYNPDTCTQDADCRPPKGMENGFICGYDPKATDTLKRCVPRVCPTGSVVCSICSNNSISSDLCRTLYNYTLSVTCLPSQNNCLLYGGSIQNPESGGTTGTSVEDLFNQLIQLSWGIIAVTMIFFVIALFISGLHLAYGLVKR